MTPYRALFGHAEYGGPIFDVPINMDMSPAAEMLAELDSEYIASWLDDLTKHFEEAIALDLKSHEKQIAKYVKSNLVCIYEVGDVVLYKNAASLAKSKSKNLNLLIMTLFYSFNATFNYKFKSFYFISTF